MTAVLRIVTFVIAIHAVGDSAFARPPNIVFFLIDDLGWTDLGCMGSKYYETPHIDRFARSGLTFLDAYSNGPNCAPSRASLMSGQYTPRHGVFTVGDPARGNDAARKLVPTPNQTTLDAKIVTIAEILVQRGYRTAAMGKWHLGPGPTHQGFHVNIAGREWGSPSGGGYHSPFDYPNLQRPAAGEYLTDTLTDEACRFIEQNSDTPFFLYLSHYAVHTPLQAKANLRAKYRAKPVTDRHRNAKYAAMIESVDDSVGRVLDRLDTLSMSDKTLVVFMSDNGGHMGATSNAPLRGTKGMLYEGGIRVPLMIRWPEVTRPGSVCREPAIGVDLYPTLLSAADCQPPPDQPLDGVDLRPVCAAPDKPLDRSLYWHFPCYLQGSGGRDPDRPFRTTPAGAIRKRDWKLIEYFEDGGLELFNLKDDLGESTNLATARPAMANELLQELRAWRQSVHAPVPNEPNPRFEPAKP